MLLFFCRDLATRNCIISSDFIVKVSYPALSKDKYNREYFKHRNTLLPIRWLAPECIQEDEYTTKSDIFAFGVVVWELFTQATKMPFEDLSNEEVIQRSQTGKLEWECAEGTPECLKEILVSFNWRQSLILFFFINLIFIFSLPAGMLIPKNAHHLVSWVRL